jgi:hypothetical protein
MDTARFDHLTRSVSTLLSRRTLAGALGLSTLTLPSPVDAKKKKRRKNKKKRKKKRCKPACQPGEVCRNRSCVCPSGLSCSSGACCATGQTCLGGECQACPVGIGLCEGGTFVCGTTPGGNPCACSTTSGGGTACIGGAELLRPVYCTPCETNADCEELLGLPGQAVCVGGVDCPLLCDDVATGCAVNGCVDVEFCDSDEECAAGTCSNHRCQ